MLIKFQNKQRRGNFKNKFTKTRSSGEGKFTKINIKNKTKQNKKHPQKTKGRDMFVEGRKDK